MQARPATLSSAFSNAEHEPGFYIIGSGVYQIMRTTILLFALFLSALSLQGSPGMDIKIDPDLQGKLRHFEAELESLRQEHHLSSLSAAVVKDHEVVWLKGLGKATPDTAFEVSGLQRRPDKPWTVRDLAQFDVISDRGAILEMRPYLAWHVEESGGNRLQWSAERETGGSMLYLKVPGKRLTLILMADGDLERTPFTDAFLKTFA